MTAIDTQSSSERRDSHLCVGLDGANPLGFLAALGTLRLMDDTSQRAEPGDEGAEPVRMSWEPHGAGYRPRLHLPRPRTREEVLNDIHHAITADFADGTPLYLYSHIIACDRELFRDKLKQAIIRASVQQRRAVDLLAGFASDACVQDSGSQKGAVQPSQLSFANGQSERKLLDDFAALIVGKQTSGSKAYPPLKVEQLRQAVFESWQYQDDQKELRWDPDEFRPGALSRNGGTVHGANALAVWGLAMLCSVPARDGLGTTAVHRFELPDNPRRARLAMTWPIWAVPASADTVRSLLSHPLLRQASPDPRRLRAMGVVCAYRSDRFEFQKGLYFSPSRAV